MKFKTLFALVFTVMLVASACTAKGENASASVDHDVGWQTPTPDLFVTAFISPAAPTLAPHAGTQDLPSMPLTAIVRENEPPYNYWVGGDTKARLCFVKA